MNTTTTQDHAATTTPGTTGQITNTVNKQVGAAKDAIAPLTSKAKGFAKARPFATAAAVGVIGLAILNTLRGK